MLRLEQIKNGNLATVHIYRNPAALTVVVVCNEDEVNPANFKWNRGKDELPIVDQYIRTLT